MDDRERIKRMELEMQKCQFRYLRNRLDEEKLYRGDPRLLIYVSLHTGQRQNQIAQGLNIKPATLTVMLNRMERAGLVNRKSDEKDQRVQRVFITEQGRLLGQKTLTVFEEATTKIYEGLSPEELAFYGEILEKIKDNILRLLGENSKASDTGTGE